MRQKIKKVKEQKYKKKLKSLEPVGKSPIFHCRIFSKPLYPSDNLWASLRNFPILEHTLANLTTLISSKASTSFLKCLSAYKNHYDHSMSLANIAHEILLQFDWLG